MAVDHFDIGPVHFDEVHDGEVLGDLRLRSDDEVQIHEHLVHELDQKIQGLPVLQRGRWKEP